MALAFGDDPPEDPAPGEHLLHSLNSLTTAPLAEVCEGQIEMLTEPRTGGNEGNSAGTLDHAESESQWD